MTIKVGKKEYCLDGYVSPINSVQQLAEECYQQGRADKYQEITSEYVLLTEQQVSDIRADAIDEFAKAIADNSYKIEEDYALREFARVCIWEDDLQKIAENLKENQS